MKKLAKACVVFLIILLGWFWLQLGAPHYAPSAGFRFSNHSGTGDCKGFDPVTKTITCTCATVNQIQLGFPIRWTGYGDCQDKEKQTAKVLDIILGVLVSTGVAGFVFIMPKLKNKP